MHAQSYLTLCNPMDCNPPAPLSMGFSRQESWSGLPLPPPGHLPNLGLNLRLLHLLHCRWILYPQSHSREPPSPCQIVQGASPDFSARGPLSWGGSRNPERTSALAALQALLCLPAWDVVALCLSPGDSSLRSPLCPSLRSVLCTSFLRYCPFCW